MDQVERKASLSARLGVLEASLALDGSTQAVDEDPLASAAPTAAGTSGLPDGSGQPEPHLPKRRLPTWLTAPVPLQEPVSAPAQEPARPKVSIRARAAAADAAAVLAIPAATQAVPVSAAPAGDQAAEPLPRAVVSGTIRDVATGQAVGAVNLHDANQPGAPRMTLAARLTMPRSFSRPTQRPQAAASSAAAAAGAGPGVAGTAADTAADTQPAHTAAKPAAQQAAPQGAQELLHGADGGLNAAAPAVAAAARAPKLQDTPQPVSMHTEGCSAKPEPSALASHATTREHQPPSPGGCGYGDAGNEGDGGDDDDTLWESDSEAGREQQAAEVTEQPQQELTLQQRQQRQMAQLGLKVPLGAAAGGSGGGEDGEWLRGVFASAAGSGGSRRPSRKTTAAAAEGRSNGRSAGSGGGGGSGGSRVRSGGGGRSGRGCSGAWGSGGAARAAAPGRGHGPGGQDEAAAEAQQGDLQHLAREQQDVFAAPAGGEDGEDGDQPDPLVLYNPEANLRLQVPGSIKQHLRSYQQQGVQFLFSRYAAGVGGVLCDDMGLGKTVQAICFIAALLGKQGTLQDSLPRSFAAFRRHRQQQRQQQRQLCAKEEQQGDGADGEGDARVCDATSAIRWPVLVVCPTSVLDNWLRELNMWGTFKVLKYHGPPAVREAMADDAAGGQYEVILASYDTLRVDAAALAELNPHAVIFDEAHKLKNPKSKQYEAAASLPTKYRYGLSGTIMQNDWEELYAVLDLLCPNCLGEYGGFVEYYSKPIKRGQSSTASNYDMVKGEKRRRQLVDVVQQVTLRRTKAIIADQLPRKTDNVVFCQLQPLQYRAYDRTLASPDLQALRLAKSPCGCGSGLKSAECCHSMVPADEGGVLWPHYHCCDCHVEGCNRHRPLGCQEYYESLGYNNSRLRCPYCLMLPAISLLTKISNHIELIRPDAKLQEVDERQFNYELSVARLVLGPDAEVLGGLLANSTGWLGASDETHCGKMATLKMLLRTWASDYSSHNKVLVFSHSTRCLDLLEAFVQRQGYDYLRLDGSTPQKNRQGICDEFNNRPSIYLLLMSTVAGGLGLNLTAANKVVVFDPSWNPAHDLQAQDRAYRLGQTRDVAVYRLVGTGTLEEAVYKRQIYKQQQSNMVIDGAEEPRYWEGVQGDIDKPGELWGLWNLLRFSGQTVETRDILQAYHGRHRQQLEQQLKDDAQKQQQQPGPGSEAVPAAAAAGGVVPAKPFKIVVLDQLVGAADDDPSLDGVMFDQDDPAAPRTGRPTARAARKPHGRKRGSSHDAGADGGDAAEAAGSPAAAAAGVGGIANADEAWCDESLLGVILDDLLPQEDSEPAPRQLQRKRRRRAVITDSDADDGDGSTGTGRHKADDGPGAGGVLLHELAPVAEDDAEGLDSMDDALQQLDDSTDREASSDGGMGGAVEPVDPVLAVLEEQGAIMHVHKHEKVLGKTRRITTEQQSPHQGQQRQARGRRRQSRQQHSQQQQRQAAGGTQPMATGSLVRRSVAEAYRCCSQAVAAAADGAAQQEWGPVASLAVWQGVGVVEMAEWLLQQTAQKRQAVLSMYRQDAALV